jgi:YhcN/YlaJ family sporulation lipoprotein
MQKYFMWLVLLVVFLTGCQNNSAANDERNNDNLVRVKNTTPQPEEQQSNNAISQRLINLATDVPKVERATAVVVGKYAIVGIDVGGNLDRSEVSSIKYAVAESLKHDPNGANAVVIADPDTFSRLQGMAQEIRNGRPVTGVLDELAAIVDRFVPEMANEIRQKHPNETNTNNDRLNEQNQQELQKEQNDQSNNELQDKE